jgi:hypothetical protein
VELSNNKAIDISLNFDESVDVEKISTGVMPK